MEDTDKRRTQRVVIHTEGVAVIEGRRLNFRTHNLSLGGSAIELPAAQAPEIGAPIKVFLDGPGFAADASVCWRRPARDGLAAVGLQFRELDFAPDAREAFLADSA